MGPSLKPLFTSAKVFLPPPALAKASWRERMGWVDPIPKIEGGMKRFLAYERNCAKCQDPEPPRQIVGHGVRRRLPTQAKMMGKMKALNGVLIG